MAHPADDSLVASPSASAAFELALLSDLGTERPNNEDACGSAVDGPIALFVVADGVGGYEGGELASRLAVDVTMSSFREYPAAWGVAKRLYRAVQQANIEIHDRALVVPELRRMATTLTAVVIEDGMLHAAHVGDCRLHLLREGQVTRMTKDHTVAGDKMRLGLMSAERAREHPDRSTLTRSLGPELIVAVDRISAPLVQNDVLVLCTDGMHNVLEDVDFLAVAAEDAQTACRKLVDEANARGTGDNVTVAVFRVTAPTPERKAPRGWRERWLKLLGG